MRADRVFAGRPAVVGHRGLGRGVVAGHQENSVGSLLAAVDLGVDWVELDVTRTVDDVLVVHHNPADDVGGFLVEQPAHLLLERGVATSRTAFEALPPGVAVDVDLKTVLEDAPLGAGGGTVALLAPLLALEVRRRRLLVTSFDVAALLWLRERVPGLPLGLIGWVDFPLRMAVTAAAAPRAGRRLPPPRVLLGQRDRARTGAPRPGALGGGRPPGGARGPGLVPRPSGPGRAGRRRRRRRVPRRRPDGAAAAAPSHHT